MTRKLLASSYGYSVVWYNMTGEITGGKVAAREVVLWLYMVGTLVACCI